jgi:hypothetical protein
MLHCLENAVPGAEQRNTVLSEFMFRIILQNLPTEPRCEPEGSLNKNKAQRLSGGFAHTGNYRVMQKIDVFEVNFSDKIQKRTAKESQKTLMSARKPETAALSWCSSPTTRKTCNTLYVGESFHQLQGPGQHG